MQSAELGCKKSHFMILCLQMPYTTFYLCIWPMKLILRFQFQEGSNKFDEMTRCIINTNPSRIHDKIIHFFHQKLLTFVLILLPVIVLSHLTLDFFRAWRIYKSVDLLYWLSKSNSHIITYRVFRRLITGSLDWQNLTIVSQKTDIIEHPAHTQRCSKLTYSRILH